MKTRSDFVRVGIKPGVGTVHLGGPNYSFSFVEGEPGLEILRSEWTSSRFDDVREHLEVTEDPVTVPDPTEKE